MAAKAPKVTTGTLFLGKFITDASSTLNSTKFGVPYSNKPVALKGWYKYTPGEIYYLVTKEPYDQNCHKEFVVDENKTDEFAIMWCYTKRNNMIWRDGQTFDWCR